MATQYFTECSTVDEAKQLYRRLCMANHPDRGGDVAIMQAINAEYQSVLASFNGQEFTGTDGKARTYRYNQQWESKVADKLNEIIAAGLDIEIMLIGSWIWITGDTKPHRAKLKELGLKWHSKRIAWFWHPPTKRRRYNSKVTLEELADNYGCATYKSERPKYRQIQA